MYVCVTSREVQRCNGSEDCSILVLQQIPSPLWDWAPFQLFSEVACPSTACWATGPLTLTALLSGAWRPLLTQSPSARLPAPPVLCVEPARLPSGPGSTAATPHLSVPSQDSVCQLPILGLLFLHTELLSLPLLQEIEH